MTNREKNIIRLAIMAAILALNLLGLSVAAYFIFSNDEPQTAVQRIVDTETEVRYVFLETDDGDYNNFICEDCGIDCDIDCDCDCEGIIVVEQNIIQWHFSFNRRGAWRGDVGFRTFPIFGGSGINRLGTEVAPMGIGFLGGGDAVGVVSLGFAQDDDGLPVTPLPVMPDDLMEDDVGFADEVFDLMDEMQDDADEIDELEDFSDDLPEVENSDDEADDEDGNESIENDENSDVSDEAPPSPQSPSPTEIEPQINPQTSDDFSIIRLAVSTLGLLLSGLILVIIRINKKAARQI
ncbi:MAG: DNA polymerase V family protein [Defluviitaleaceae bacterium]|nr:DNA polymerase V family protein [Defluviitaleaceae bacterium]